MGLIAATEVELRYGIAVLPAGNRRDRLAEAPDAMLADDFDNDVLPFDSVSARIYAARRRAAGRPIAHADEEFLDASL